MPLNTDGFPLINPNVLTGFETMFADTYALGGTQPQSVGLSLAAVLFASAAGQPTALTASNGAVTSTATKASVTTDALTLSKGQTYTLTITNSTVTTSKRVYAQIRQGTDTATLRLEEALAAPIINSITVSANTITIVVGNQSADNVLNGTCVIDYVVL